MTAFEETVLDLSATMEVPPSYGWFHLLFVGLTTAAALLLCLLLRNAKEAVFRAVLLAGWLLIVAFECYKQTVLAFRVEDGAAIWEYYWHSFPFQFCSSPLYVLPFAALLPDGRARDGALAFLATFVLFAGFCVYVFPGDVFTEIIGIDLQTMIHHGAQISLGALILVHERKRWRYRMFADATVCFLDMSLSSMGATIEADKASVTLEEEETITRDDFIRETNGLREEINGMREDIHGLKESWANADVYLDSGELVGVMAPRLDQEFGNLQKLGERGI